MKNRFPGWADDELFQRCLIGLLALTVFFSKLGLNGMANYDDCFYAEKAKEILQNHNWWVLTFNHLPAFENPPGYMWLAALSYKIFGVSVYAAKFPSALMGFLSVLLIYSLGTHLFNRLVGFFAAFILTLSYPFFKYARHAMVDVTLTFFVMASLYCLLLALRGNKRYFLMWGFCAGLGILVKSVLGLFPLLISAVFIGLTSQWKKTANPYFGLGLGIALALGCSWYIVEYISFGGDFLAVHFGWLIFKRGFQSGPEPWYRHFSYLLDLATYDWPWLPLAVGGVVFMFRSPARRNPHVVFVLVWIFSIVGIMSLMQARVIWYILPAFPALALASAYALDFWLKDNSKKICARIFLAAGATAVILVNALPFPLDKNREKDVRALSPAVKYFAESGFRVVAFREDYYGLNNALLFFSDHAAQAFYGKPAELAGEFASKKPVLCLAPQADLPELRDSLRGWSLAQKRGDLMLISNQRLDLAEVPQMGPHE